MHYLTFIFIILLSACNSSSSESNKSATSFAITVEHVNLAVSNQLVMIKITPNSSFQIKTTTLTVDDDITLDISKKSESEYQLLIPNIYTERTLFFTTQATSSENKTAISQSSIELIFNQKPELNLVNTPEFVQENSTILFEISVEDEHNHGAISLESEHSDVSFEKTGDNTFSVNIPEFEYSQQLSFIARTTDEFGLLGANYLSINVLNDDLYLAIRGQDEVLVNSDNYYAINEDLPDEIKVSQVNWSQVDGSELIISEPSEPHTKIHFPLSYGSVNYIIKAEVTLSNQQTYIVEKHVNTIENRRFTRSPLDAELVRTLFEKKYTPPVFDLDQNGLNDLITIEGAIFYIELQNNDGIYQDKQIAGEITFNRFLSATSTPPKKEELRIFSTRIVDIDLDGIKDLLFTGHISYYPEELFGESIVGFIKGVSAIKFIGDNISTLSEYSTDCNFLDINKDGFIDCVHYDITNLTQQRLSYGTTNGFVGAYHYKLQNGFQSLNANCCETSNLGYLVGIPSLGDVDSDNNSDILALYDEQMTLYGKHQWLTVSSYDEKFSIYIDDTLRAAYLLDVTNDGIDDILIYSNHNGYELIKVIE